MDFVSMTFWVATAAMLASSIFFFLERFDVSPKWKTSVTVAGLVTFVAFWHYLYMRGVWVDTGMSPTELRYIDWLITVPLQIVEFYLILAAVTKVKANLFWQLLGASLVMLVFGYLGEANILDMYLAFAIGMLGWLYVIYLVFFGAAKKLNAESGNPSSQMAFNAIRIIVLVGWAIYPIGFVLGNFGDLGIEGVKAMNAIYNLADLVNKTAFGLVIWYAAKKDSEASSS
ncbi:MAG: biphenyl 2,3-dioxygenase [Dehalococcoidia bacterium]|jgi:bacteriorhodopsin|nr:biphenyl 2,3-dioxygenase [Dehalococcoidia bacterium]MQG25439.1 biphenyl 2,3-dioxygenase [SAR202 cluster bacterium]CAI8258806.1 MAG: Blue-light absorbing proteorhodopsin [Chloroflexota bacterium]MCH2528810.1 bacteriorhodopsin-like [Dehalococcoidia bacterium]MQG51969.1 biphenyl 2,3-dioxygenase [SAR202 cluster bacterium]|tara:strand:+ start:2040 stop:2726 length:687 start_codon:yes stop_codon:yes gene_type:complete